MKKDLLIGIDASTTACKAVVWDCHGKQIASSRREIPLLRPQADWYEQRAEDIHTAMFEALRIIDQLVDTTRLAGICICPQRETFITVDVNGNPLRNAILWMDNRARDWLPDLEWNLGRDNFLNLTGKPPSGNLTTLKLRWLREMEEDVFRHGYKFLDVAAFLNHTLTGKFATGWGIADPTGLFDMKAKCWSEQVMGYLQISPERLPLAYPTGTHIGDISVAASRKTGLQAGLPVFAGLGDGQAGGLALNILQPGACYLSLGTSVVSGTYSCDFLTSRNFRTMFAGNHDGYSLESVILGGTYTIDWFLDYFAKGCSIAALEKEIGKLPPGAEGLILVPYWNSVLNPYWDPEARGITLGWTGTHGPVHFYLAILEGIAFELRLHYEGVEIDLGSPIEHLVVTGGGSNSDAWCQIIADITGKTLKRSRTTEATALGAAVIGAYGAGLFPKLEFAADSMAADHSEIFHPDPKNLDRYDQLYKDVYREIFPSVQQLVKRLTSIVMKK